MPSNSPPGSIFSIHVGKSQAFTCAIADNRSIDRRQGGIWTKKKGEKSIQHDEWVEVLWEATKITIVFIFFLLFYWVTY